MQSEGDQSPIRGGRSLVENDIGLCFADDRFCGELEVELLRVDVSFIEDGFGSIYLVPFGMSCQMFGFAVKLMMCTPSV